MGSRIEIALFIADRFSLFGYAVASEMFRFANESLGEELYFTQAVSVSGRAVTASNGTMIMPSAPFREASCIDTVVLCSGAWGAPEALSRDLLAWLRAHHRHGGSICSLATGVWPLAASGLLDRSSCSAHWSEIAALDQAFPTVRFTTSPFTVSARIWTCSGGDSVTDMILSFLSARHDLALSDQVRRMLLLKPAQALRDQRDILMHDRTSEMEIIAEQLLGLIEENIEKPLSIQELCRRLSIPQRTLNRYCHRLFGQSPKEIYQGAKLTRAKSLLTNTRFPIREVAQLCGFRRAAHFTAVFKSEFGRTPGEHRRSAEQASEEIR